MCMNKILHVDVNECAFGNGGCADTCTNLGGSYRCTCNNGLFLQADGLSCSSTPPCKLKDQLISIKVLWKMSSKIGNQLYRPYEQIHSIM